MSALGICGTDSIAHPLMMPRTVTLVLSLFVISVPLICWAIEIFGVAFTASHILGLVLLVFAAGIWSRRHFPVPRGVAVLATAAFFVVAALTVVLVQIRPDIEVHGEAAHSKSLKQLVGLGFAIALFTALYCLLLWYRLGLAVMRVHYWTTVVVSLLTILQYGVAWWDMTSSLANFPVHNSTLGEQRPLSLMYGFPRVSFTMVEPSILATYLLTGWAVWLYTLERPILMAGKGRRAFLWSGLLLGAAIIVTGSRLAYVVLFVLAVTALAVRPSRILRAALIAAGVILGFALTGPENTLRLAAPLLPKSSKSDWGSLSPGGAVDNRSAKTLDESLRHRLASYLVAMRVLQERPLLGTGFGTSSFHMEGDWPSSFTPLATGRVAAPTMLSQYATVATETGLIGLLCLTVVAFSVFGRLWKLARVGTDDRFLAWGVGASVASYYMTGIATAFVVYQVLLVWVVLALALTVTGSPELMPLTSRDKADPGHPSSSPRNSLAERT